MKIGKSFHFDAAHYLPNHPKCGVIHGHTWKVGVEIEGEVIDGMILDLHTLKSLMKDITDLYDHKLINDVMSFPTVENLATNIAASLAFALKAERLLNIKAVQVKVQEGEGGYAIATFDLKENKV